MNEEYRDALRQASEMFGRQLDIIAGEVVRGEIGDEDDVSSQILGRLKAVAPAIEGPISWDAKFSAAPGIRMSSRHLTSRGAGAEEKRIGADIVLVLDIDIPGYKMTKGLFVQAKCVNARGEARSSDERERLVGQCEDMLAVTPAAFVWTYGSMGVRLFSANAVLGSDGVFDDIAATWPAETFFFDFLICWIGDARIVSVTRPSLDSLMEMYGAEKGLLIRGRSRRAGED